MYKYKYYIMYIVHHITYVEAWPPSLADIRNPAFGE